MTTYKGFAGLAEALRDSCETLRPVTVEEMVRMAQATDRPIVDDEPDCSHPMIDVTDSKNLCLCCGEVVGIDDDGQADKYGDR